MLGESLGPYRIDRELGAGGMGRVFAATLLRDAGGLAAGATVALKVLHPHLLEAEGFFKRFLREAQIGRSVRHQNVVRTLDCDAIGGAHFLVMEYVEGQTLAELLQELDRLPEDLCRHVGREICKGLAAIHATGVIHRDLKPENVIISLSTASEDELVAKRAPVGTSPERAARDGNASPRPAHVVKVMDLGVARLADENLRLSQSGAFVGSVEYAAPEQFRGDEVDARTDLHALGVVLYELATGVHPFRGGGFHEVLRRVCETTPRRIGDINPQLSPLFEEIVHTLLVKDPRGRFGSAAEVQSVLEHGEDSTWWITRSRALRVATNRPIRRIRIPRDTAVHGRDDELAVLQERFERAARGDGQVVLVQGEAGIGKSRLVDELVGRLHAAGEDLDFLHGSYPPGGAATASGAFSIAYREHFGESGCAPYLPETSLLAPAFEALLRGDAAPPGAEPLTKDSLQSCFVSVTRALAAERVAIVLIDDLHFAPEEGRALFTALAMAAPGHRVLLIGTARPGIPEEWVAGLTRLPHAHQLPLQRLGAKQLVLLLEDAFRSKSLAASLGARIAVKSDGNPFFAFEIVRGLRESHVIRETEDGSWVSTGRIEDIEIPSTVKDLVNARVAGLSQEERDVLDVAACWGFEFDPALIADVVGMGRIPLLKLLAQVERKHRIVRASGRQFTFDHHQVQESLYASLPEMLREEYHAALAGALESRTGAAVADAETLDGSLCAELCDHFLRGARGRPALRYLPAAQEHLAAGHLHDQIVALTERALAVPGLLEGTERADVLLSLCNALDMLGRREWQSEVAEEAQRLAAATTDADLQRRAAMECGTLAWRTSQLDAAEAAFRRAQSLAEAAGDVRGEASATGSLGLVHADAGRMDEAAACIMRELELAERIGDHKAVAAASGALGGIHRAQGRFERARELFERHRALSRESGNRAGDAAATANLGVVELGQGHHDAARAHLEAALGAFRQLGNRPNEAATTGNLGSVAVAEGRLADACDLIQRHLDLSREIGSRSGEAVALVNLGAAWLGVGELDRGRAALEQSIRVARTIDARYPEGFALLSLAEIADEEGDSATSRRLSEESLALRREIGHEDGVVDALLHLGDLARRTGDVDRARAALEEAARLSEDEDCAAEAVVAHAELACLPGGDVAAALGALAAAGIAGDTPRVRLLLHTATGDRRHLEQAKDLLEAALAKVPAKNHATLLANLRVPREIIAAWTAEKGARNAGPNERATRSE